MEENPVIFVNGHVVTCDASNRTGKFHVVVRDGRIQEIGGLLEVLTTMYPSASVVNLSGKLLLPGFVNAHFHTESFLLQELTSDKPFNTWAHSERLRGIVDTLLMPGHEDHLTSVLRATYAAHLKSGTTCLGEHLPPADLRSFGVLLRTSEALRLRIVATLQTWDQIEHARDISRPLVRFLIGLGPESDYTVYSFENFVRAAREIDCGIAAHIGEQKDDVAIIRRNFSKSPTALLHDFGALQKRTALIHGNHGTAEDAQRLAASGAALIVCPVSSLHKQCGYPFLRVLARNPVRFGVGTDWGNIDVLTELRFLHDLPRLFALMPEFSALRLIRMATIDGANALGVGEDTGSIEVGKQADMIAVDLSDVRRRQPEEGWTAELCAQQLLRLPGPLTPMHVMVAGKFVVKDFKFVDVHEDETLEHYIAARAAILPQHGDQHRRPRDGTADSAIQKPKIYAFASGERGGEKDEQGFIGGITTVPVRPAADEVSVLSDRLTDETADTRPRAPIDQRKPPGLVRKVFGEDDVA